MVNMPASAAGKRLLVRVMVQSVPTQPALFAGMLKTMVSGSPSLPATARASRREQSAALHTPSSVLAVLVTVKMRGTSSPSWPTSELAMVPGLVLVSPPATRTLPLASNAAA